MCKLNNMFSNSCKGCLMKIFLIGLLTDILSSKHHSFII